ncbi:TRAP transporter fused permease subunit [Acuticoccus sp. M5D2P5]|uniref:TRAP transporter permease n=1 Tax=Acuticoccus kalidii TaxID=2910977 RepID=UPI001F1BC2CA|nr:TRAP transporter fused permease subunit [Acuticoccus kalidii]MCF3933648.1 TRAP transporter fused permease subunit [Acuticoccus kalidii]
MTSLDGVVTPLDRAGPGRAIWIALGALTIGFHLWLVISGLTPALIARPIHMALALPWIFLFVRGFSRTGLVLTIVGVAACLYIAINNQALGDQYGMLYGREQYVVAFVLLGIVLEMARRAIGWPLPLVALIALLYAFFGQYIPGEFGHAGLPPMSLLGTLVIAEGGLWGELTGISVGVVAVFVIFGAVLNAGEAGQGFMNLASSAAGRLRGGAAKVSVLSSALFGSISGSASANVASTGAVTLPAMRRLGYPRPLAGAVEAVASSGGQIMPPLMGAGAFVMVELTGIPYSTIMVAALPPALLYFFTVWIGIDAFATRYRLAGLPAEERPGPRDVIVTSCFFLVPFTILLVGMFGYGLTPQYAATFAIFAGFLLLFTDGRLTLDLGRTARRLANAALTAGEQVAVIASVILCASIVVGVLGMTGLGVKVTSLILSGSSGLVWPALLLTALACLILGMEVPTTAAYVICVSVAGPALIELGLEPLQAHLFVFWYALLSTITPPVCGAVFIAAGMVEAPWLRVAGAAMALGVGLYLVPLAMVANPALISLGETPVFTILAVVKVALGLAAISWGTIAKGRALLRAALVVGGLAIILWSI